MDFFWNSFTIEDGEMFRHDLGDFEIRIKRIHDELLIASVDNSEEIIESDIDWKRFVTGNSDVPLNLRPLTPDLPMVVNPEFPVQILPGQNARFFIIMPAWVQVSFGKSDPINLHEFPTATLSATWFGGPVDGILSYSLNSPAYRRYDDSSIPACKPMEIIAPLTVKNRSTELLSLQDLNIHCEHLRVYQGIEHNWTNEVKISFYGGNQPSKVQYVEKKPSFEEMGKDHGEARVKVRQDILAKSYSFLKNFTA